MNYSLTDLLLLAGSLGLFIYGMKMMSDGLQKATGNKLREILKGMTSSRTGGIFTGFLTTSLVQSSSATTIMVVSFVNAGMLTLSESMCVIMGANIGTTITAWIIAIFGFQANMKAVAIVLIGIIFPFLFSKNNNLKHTSELIMGFAVLFIGFVFLMQVVPDIRSNHEILGFISIWFGKGFLSILLFIGIGALLTVIVQSSSATIAVTLVMLAKGWIDLPMAAAMVLGENIGTTITANIASIIGNVHAKRAARFHLIFNVTGAVWMVIIFYPFLHTVEYMSMYFEKGLYALTFPVDGEIHKLIAVALFHSSFNIVNVLLMVWFIPFFERVLKRVQPSRGREDEEIRLTYISGGVMSTPELSLAEARKEIQFFGKLINKMHFGLSTILFEPYANKESILEKIRRREDLTDNIELSLVDFLTKVSESDLSQATSGMIPAFLSIANDLERMADIYYQMAKNYERMTKLSVKMPEDANHELKEILGLLEQAIKLMRENLEKSAKDIQLSKVYELEDKINDSRKTLRKAHYQRLEKNIYDSRAGVIYLDYVNRAERIGDHIVNVSEALAGIK